MAIKDGDKLLSLLHSYLLISVVMLQLDLMSVAAVMNYSTSLRDMTLGNASKQKRLMSRFLSFHNLANLKEEKFVYLKAQQPGPLGLYLHVYELTLLAHASL